MGTPYVDIDFIKLNSLLRAEDVDDLERDQPGSVAAICANVSAVFDSRLTKRYAVPFASPYPDALRDHVGAVVAYRIYLKRGANPDNPLAEGLKELNDAAKAWLTDAVDSEKGTTELPLREVLPREEGVAKASPLFYSEPGPYNANDVQIMAVRNG